MLHGFEPVARSGFEVLEGAGDEVGHLVGLEVTPDVFCGIVVRSALGGIAPPALR